VYRSVFDDPILTLSLAWFYVVSTFLVGWVAAQKGRSGVGWFMLSLVLSPVLCLLALVAVPDERIERNTRPAQPVAPEGSSSSLYQRIAERREAADRARASETPPA